MEFSTSLFCNQPGFPSHTAITWALWRISPPTKHVIVGQFCVQWGIYQPCSRHNPKEGRKKNGAKGAARGKGRGRSTNKHVCWSVVSVVMCMHASPRVHTANRQYMQACIFISGHGCITRPARGQGQEMKDTSVPCNHSLYQPTYHEC